MDKKNVGAVAIGRGKLAGKGVYAQKDFRKGEEITCDDSQDDVP